MSSHRAVFRFRAGHFDLKTEAFGRQWEFERDGRRVVLSLPSRPDSFGSYIEALTISTRRGGDKDIAWDEDRVLVAAVGAIEVSVDADVEISSTELTPDEHPEEIDRGQAALDAAFPTALDVAVALISWLRVRSGRYWLAPSHEAPAVLSGDLVETSSGRRVRNIGFNPVVHITGFGRDAGLTAEELDQVPRSLRREMRRIRPKYSSPTHAKHSRALQSNATGKRSGATSAARSCSPPSRQR
jgi:hypothetical protein